MASIGGFFLQLGVQGLLGGFKMRKVISPELVNAGVFFLIFCLMLYPIYPSISLAAEENQPGTAPTGTGAVGAGAGASLLDSAEGRRAIGRRADRVRHPRSTGRRSLASGSFLRGF